MVCVKDDDNENQNLSRASGSAQDARSGIRCPRGYHVLGSLIGDYSKYNLTPAFSIYSRKKR